MPRLSPCAIFMLVILLVILVSYLSARAWARGFSLAYEGCQLGAFDDSFANPDNNTYSEGLSNNIPAYASAARQAQTKKRQEGFIYRETTKDPKQHTPASYHSEHFGSFDYIVPLETSPATEAANLVVSPFVGYLQ